MISAELEMTVNMLIQIDKLVQLLESPVFTYLRLQLLEPERYPFLYKCMYGLLMLLPQSSAFAALKNRLNSVSAIGYLHIANYSMNASGPGGASRTYVSSQVNNFHRRQTSYDNSGVPGPSSLLSPLNTVFPQPLSSTSSPSSSPLGTQAHTSGPDRQSGTTSAGSVVSNFERPNRLKAREDNSVRWVELLDNFKTTQERARKQSRGQMYGGEDMGGPPPVPEKEVGVAVADQTRGLQQRVIPRAGTPTLAVGQAAPLQKPVVKSKVGLGLGRFGGSKKDKKK